jgi:hypothetical protein
LSPRLPAGSHRRLPSRPNGAGCAVPASRGAGRAAHHVRGGWSANPNAGTRDGTVHAVRCAHRHLDATCDEHRKCSRARDVKSDADPTPGYGDTLRDGHAADNGKSYRYEQRSALSHAGWGSFDGDTIGPER